MSRTVFLNVFDRNKKKTAVLENAYDITETQELNHIYSLTFDIPASDPKIKYLLPFHYVRYGEDGQLYRIVKKTENETDISTLHIECEHVIASLVDTVMFGSTIISGRKTALVIGDILEKQNVKNWKLGTCDFDRKFEYGWEQENLLNALYSIPKEFSEAYYWDFDTSSMTDKWSVSLKRLDILIHPEFYIRAKQNLLSQGCEQDNTNVCTKLYPLGYGEGVNQLTIKGVKLDSNGDPSVDGIPYQNTYILASQSAIDQYGIIEKILVDRRFENAESLYSYAKTVLEGLSVPSYSRSFDVTDLYPIANEEIYNAKVGKVCKLTGDGTIAYITKTVRVLDDPGNLKLELSTKATDVVSMIADLADRVRIESVYAQGATQLYQHSKEANAASEDGKGMMLNLYFPSEMRQINKVLLKVQLDKFRSYSATTEDNGGVNKQYPITFGSQTISDSYSGQKTTNMKATGSGDLTTTEDGGSTGETESFESKEISGSGTADAVWDSTSGTFETTAYDGTVEDTSESDVEGPHKHTYQLYYPSLSGPLSQFHHSHDVSISCGKHSHKFSIGGHSHKINISHQHTYDISHTHTFTIPEKKFNLVIEPHSHEILPGIFEDTKNNSTKFTIYVSGVRKKIVNSTNWESDIVEWLLDDKRQVPRDTWIKIEIRPNKLAYVITSVFVQGFVQSRGGGNY